ncbi:MAG TPA: hypothetical protein VK463_03860 [Desulfomonilaceae bacterium]|nr:hypothetical protein [Desulfomonilaceae bacterium]
MPHLMGQNWSDPVRFKNITLIGVLHYRVEFSVLVNTYIRNEKPDVICVELPHALRKEIVPSLRRLPYHSVIVYETASQENAVLIVEGSDGVQEAARSALELQIPLWYVDPLPMRFPLFLDRMPDAYVIDKIGQKTFVEKILPAGTRYSGGDEDNDRRETFMASRLQQAAHEHENVLFVGGLAHIPGILDRLKTPQPLPLMKTGVKAALTAPVHPDSLKKGFTEIPKITEAFEHWRTSPGDPPPENRHEMIVSLMQASVDYFVRQTRQEVPEYARVTWAKFLRKWLSFRGELLPDLYHLVSSARSAMDEDFAYHVHEFLSDYEWANDPLDPSAVVLNEDNLMFFGHKIVLHKKLRTFFHTSRKYRMKAVNSAKWREHLKRKWETADPNTVDICSYPPEDVEVERWGETLMKHANHVLQTVQTHSEPFIADFGGGPDIREMLRKLHEKRIYVKTEDESGMDFGSIVVIFDPDEPMRNYPFQMTWLGEHSQESDMAFYSTPPGSQIVGPGISRMEYGAFMLSYPPMRMFDIWIDSSFDFLPTRHERLLIAGIVYSEKQGIVYVARKPPAAKWKKFAKSMGRRIIYIPLGSLNPLHVKRMRTFHMLQNKGLRNSAHEFFKKKE